jgi:hypothetical protein
MDTPYFSPESITAMVAGGAQIVLFTTGAGNSFCSLVAPTLKMSGNPETCAHLAEQIDVAAADVAAGTTTLDERAEAAIDQLVEVASGSLTFGEIVGEGAGSRQPPRSVDIAPRRRDLRDWDWAELSAVPDQNSLICQRRWSMDRA